MSKKFSLIMVDIDNFKMVNDTYGHQNGDIVIKSLADILIQSCNNYTNRFTAGRWGGEEFMLLLSETEISAAEYMAEWIRQSFSRRSISGIQPQTISVGVTQIKEEDTVDSLCSRVDSALYKAKKTGKNRVIVL